MSEPVREFGSLIAAVVGIGLGFAAWGIGMHWWDNGRRAGGAALLSLGVVFGLQSTIGVLFSLDMWSLLRLMF